MATSGSWDISWQSGWWSSTSSIKSYHWSGNWSKSGTTITLSSMKLWLTTKDTSWGSGQDTVTVTGGSAQNITISFPSNSSTTSNQTSLNNTSFTVATSATSATITCAIVDEQNGSTTISFDATYVAPTTPTVTIGDTGTTSVKVNYGTTSFGTPSTGTVYLYGGTATAPTTQIASKTTTGSSQYTWSDRAENTTYYFRARAYNGNLYSSYTSTVSGVTLPPQFLSSLTLSSRTSTSITSQYVTYADGGALAKTLQYSTSSATGSWTTAATISSGAETTGTFTVSGLTPNTAYTIYARIYTSAGGGSSWNYYPTSTTPPVPNLSQGPTTYATAIIKYGVPNQGGNYNMHLQYRLGSGSWTTVSTLSGSGAKNGTFTLSGLMADTTYNLQIRLVTTAGTATSETLSFATKPRPAKFYAPDDEVAATLGKFYGPVNGKAVVINRLYGSEDGKAVLIYQSYPGS